MIIISENLKKELDGIAVHNLSSTVNRHYLTEKRRQYMKATGIVRRIDGCVIIGQSLEGRINAGFSLILSIQQ